MTTPNLMELYGYIDQHANRSLELLKRLAAQPSISAQNLGLEEMAELCRQSMAERDIDTQLLPTDGGPPIVYGKIEGASDKTLLLYNHYDVQPVDPLELWDSPPFEPTIRDGKLFARGVADDKDDIAIRMEAVNAWRTLHGKLPCTIKFLFEGEEESGSPHFYQFVEKHQELLRADACMMEAGGLRADGRPSLTPGVKGMLNIQLSVRTAQNDGHSALAAVAPSSAWRLLWALNSLKGPDGRIQIAGFYDDVRDLTPLERESIEMEPSTEENVKEALGIEKFLDDLTGYVWQEQLYNAPTCNIQGFITGYTGPGYKTVLPATATAKLDFRLVPNQQPQDILRKLRHHLDSHGFQDVIIDEIYGAESPARTPLDNPFILFLKEISEEFVGRPTVVIPNMAGTAPMDAFVEVLKIPTTFSFGGAGYYGSQIHAPNEHIRIADLATGIKFMALVFARFPEIKFN